MLSILRSSVNSASRYGGLSAMTRIAPHHFGTPNDSMNTGKRHLSTYSQAPMVEAASFLDSVGGTGGIGGGLLATTLLAGAFAASRYKVASAGEYLVRTGIFIEDIDISKQAFHLPFQTFNKIKLEPGTYECTIKEAMSYDKISFNLPTVFTIGPKDETASLKMYAKLLQQSSHEDLKAKILGIIQGETRMAAGQLHLDDLFNNREKFKATMVDKINEQLADFGLFVYNANIEELKDMENQAYFSNLRKRALEMSVNKAKVDVAEQNRIGNVGEKLHDAETRKQVAEYTKAATLVENERNKEIAASNADLAVAKTVFERNAQIAQFEANAAAEQRKWQLQKEVEEHRNRQETERLRATEYSVANVKAEIAIREAQAYADAVKLKASADAEAIKMRAEAHFIEKENEAKGILKLREAESEGLSKLIMSAGTTDHLNSYLMVRDGMITEIAKQQASAVRDMKPHVTVWQTGQKENGMNGLSGVVTDLVKTGVPLIEQLKQSTGIDLLKSYRPN